MIHLLTSQPGSGACAALLRQARLLGIPLRAGRGQAFADGDVVFAYGASRRLLATLGPTRALLINAAVYPKHQQYERLAAAGIPVPRWRRVSDAVAADDVTAVAGEAGAAILKPDLGGFGNGVRLVDATAAAGMPPRPLRRAHVVQEFIPCGGRCARVVVLGDAVAWAIDRVARDGVVAAYQHGRRGWLEPVELSSDEERLCVAAARTLGIEIAGVDLIRSARGPFILEVNHRFVPYHLRAMYGDVPRRIVLYLHGRARQPERAPAEIGRFRPALPWRLPRAVGSWRGLHRAAAVGAAQLNAKQRVANGRR
jgi:hypothetical protein